MITTMHQNTDLTDRLWNFVQGEPDTEIEAHVQSCKECRDEIEVLSGLRAARTAGDFPPVPEPLTSTLTDLFSKVRPDLVKQPQEPLSPVKRLRTIVADLLQDTALQPQIAGLRGESRTRQIALTSDVADLDLEISTLDNQFLVVGQLGMDEIPDNLSIRFVPEDGDPLNPDAPGTSSSKLSDQGYFRTHVAPGNWVIAVDIHDAVVLFPGIQL